MTRDEARRRVAVAGDAPRLVLEIPSGAPGAGVTYAIEVAVPLLQVVVPDIPGGVEVVLRSGRPANVRLSAAQQCDVRTEARGAGSLALTTDAALGALHVAGALRLVGEASVVEVRGDPGARLELDGAVSVERLVGRGGLVVAGPGSTLSVAEVCAADTITVEGGRVEVAGTGLAPGAAPGDPPARVEGTGTLALAAGATAVLSLAGDLAVEVGSRATLLAAGEAASIALAPDATVEAPLGSGGLAVPALRAEGGSQVLGVSPYVLDDESIRLLRRAGRVTFRLAGSHRDHLAAVRAAAKGGPPSPWRWRELTVLAAGSGDAAVARAWLAEAEMDARRRQAGWSVTGMALAAYRALGYGVRPLRPWLVHAALCAALALLVAATSDVPLRDDLARAPQLLFAGLGFLRIPALAIPPVPGIWDTAAWIVASLSGLAAAAASVLSLRPQLSRA